MAFGEVIPVKDPKQYCLPKHFAKISMRLVPNQSADKITELFSKHFKKYCSEICTGGSSSAPWRRTLWSLRQMVSPSKRASMAMETTFGKTNSNAWWRKYSIVALFEKELGLKSVLMGFGLDSDLIHSPNEHYGVFNFLKGIETIPLFFENFTKLSK